MKLLQKQIKIPQIYKYIKKNQLRWLLFLLVPLVIGLIIHFMVPLTFVLSANPFTQLNYNNNKIQIQLNTVRSLSIINSEIIRFKMQITQNLRNLLIHIFGQKNPYQTILNSSITLNNAYVFANQVQNGENVDNITARSMWYARGAVDKNDLNFIQNFVFQQYVNVQPFIRSQFLNQTNTSVIRRITLSVDYFNQDLYFQYPSQFIPQFLQLQANPYDKYFNTTMYNYKQSNEIIQYTIFTQQHQDQQEDLVICNIIFDNETPSGVACFHMMLKDIAQQLTSSLTISNVQYSTTNYYLLTPIYPSFSLLSSTTTNQSSSPNINKSTTAQPYPQIIFNFTDKNSSQINYPIQSYLPLPSSLPPSLYIPTLTSTVNYSYYIAYQTSTLIYIQVPIQIYNYRQQQLTIMFLLLQYNFQQSVFDLVNKYKEILRDLLIPSLIIIVFSTIVTLVVLKCLLNGLDDELFKVNEKCQFILHGDLDLKIQQYDNTEELIDVYKNLKIINSLHLYSTKEYFQCNQQQKIIKYFNVLQTFNQINYPTDIVYENIGDSYQIIGNYNKAIEYYEKSYQQLVKQTENMFGFKLEQIIEVKQKQQKRLSKIYRKFELKIIGKLFKIIFVYYLKLFPQPHIQFYSKSIKCTQIEQQTQLNPQYSHQYNHQLHPQYNHQLHPQLHPKQNPKLSSLNTSKPRDIKTFQQHLQIFKSLTSNPPLSTSQTLLISLIQSIFSISLLNLKQSRILLKKLQRNLLQYQTQYQQNQQIIKMDTPIKSYQQMKFNITQYCRVNPNILWGLYYYVMGKYMEYDGKKIKGNKNQNKSKNQIKLFRIKEQKEYNNYKQRDISRMIDYYRKSIQRNYYSPDIHTKVTHALIKVARQYNIPQNIIYNHLSQFMFFKQNFPLYYLKNPHFACTFQQLHKSSYSLRQPLVISPLNQLKRSISHQIFYLFDCSNKFFSQLFKFRLWQKSTRQISSLIFSYLHKFDRISILKSNSSIFLQTCCNLIYKQHNQTLILRELNNSIKLKCMIGKCQIINAIKIIINRVKNLNDQKIIIVFLKEEKQKEKEKQKQQKNNQGKKNQKEKKKKGKKINTQFNITSNNNLINDQIIIGKDNIHNNQISIKKNNQYQNDTEYKKRKNTQVSPQHKRSIHSYSNLLSFQQQQQDLLPIQSPRHSEFYQYYKNLREELISILSSPQIFNLKLILVVQNAENFKKNLRLHDVNQILYKQSKKNQNFNNNILFVCDDHNKEDYQRIFSTKINKPNTINFQSMF